MAQKKMYVIYSVNYTKDGSISHGIKGVCKTLQSAIKLFNQLKEAILEDDDRWETKELESLRMSKKSNYSLIESDTSWVLYNWLNLSKYSGIMIEEVDVIND